MKKRPFWLTVVLVVDSSNNIVLLTAVTDPDLQMRGGGVIQTLEITGGAGLRKDFFLPFGPHFSRKIRGGPVAPRAPPLGFASEQYLFLLRKSLEKRFFIYLASPN